jgi:hypothetical protein
VSKVRPKYIKEEKGHESSGRVTNDFLLFDKKVSLAIEGLEPIFDKILRQRVSNRNALIIAEYMNAAKREINISNGL